MSPQSLTTAAEAGVAEAGAADDPQPTAGTVVRLRPVVFATPTGTGVHVRGWSSSFTVSGGTGVWKVWQLLARQLAGGLSPQSLARPVRRPEVDRAVRLLLEQLREHDMLVEVPAGWGDRDDPGLPPADLARWLESVAADPAAAWDRLRSTTVTVAGTGPVAAAATRTLTGTGLTVDTPGGTGPDTVVLAGDAAVAARCLAETGYVTPVAAPGEVTAHSAAIATRLTRDTGGPAVAGPVPPALAALVGAAAAHRIVCAVAGLPDPAEEAATLPGGEPAAPGPHYPAALVARLDPVRATYHPWLPAARAPLPGGPADIDAVGLRLAALGDPVLGSVPAALPGDLPQLPAMLALAGPALGVAATADAARIDATLRYVENLLGLTGVRPVDDPATPALTPPSAAGSVAAAAVGVDARHATGVALRRLVHAVGHRLDTVEVAEAEWATAPAARRWWKALTRRFGVPARVVAHRLPTGAVHAEIVTDDGPLAWAVEADAADAVALAALAATGVAQARAAGVAVPTGPVSLAGAAPTWLPGDPQLAPWTDDTWYWPAGVIDHEERLQQALRTALTTGGATLTGRPVVPDTADTGPADEDTHAVVHALAVTGFVARGFQWTAAAWSTTTGPTATPSRGA